MCVLCFLFSNYYNNTQTLIIGGVLPAVHSNRPILAKLFFSFVHLADEINESLPGFWHSLFWPVSELELTNRSWLAVLNVKRSVRLASVQTGFSAPIQRLSPRAQMTHPGVGDFKLSEDVLGHVVLCHGIHHKVLVPGGAFCGPVLMTFLLQHKELLFRNPDNVQRLYFMSVIFGPMVNEASRLYIRWILILIFVYM